MREEARAAIATRRHVWSIRQTARQEEIELDAYEIEQLVQLRREFAALKRWDAHKTSPQRAEGLAGTYVDEHGEQHAVGNPFART